MIRKGGVRTEIREFEKTRNSAQCSVIAVIGHVSRLVPRNHPLLVGTTEN
jgi:hypothetical protein